MNTLTLFREPRHNSLNRTGWGGLFDTFFDDYASFPRTTFSKSLRERTYPTTKVVDLDDRYDIKLVVPGLNKGDLNVSLDDHT